MSRLAFQSLVLAIGLCGTAILLALILMRTGGVLVYTLDDPYIHLALAQEILRGGYGINPGEVASPSSSILYAPLLAPLLGLGLGDWSPLVLTVAGQSVALWLLAGVAAPLVATSRLQAVTMALLLPLTINGFALPLTGMEHPLHIAASVAVIVGMWHSARGRVPPWLIPVILMAAAIRFEGYALACAAILTLFALRHTRTALFAALGLIVMTVSYGGIMHALGLPLLPSSVMVKSLASAAAVDADVLDALRRLTGNVLHALGNRWGMIFAGFILLFAILTLSPRSTRQLRSVAFAGLCVLAAHLLVGRYGWFGRYEVYGVATLLCVSLLVLPQLHKSATTLALLMMVPLGLAYAPVTLRTPAAALSVFEQQYQMHRFATAYFPYPVAVNDLGWVAFDNDIRVLDLWGLGSESARRLTRDGGRTVATVQRLTDGQVAYAMIYDIAFAEAIPPGWCRIADLTTSRVIAASDQVAFYLIERPREDEMRAALDRFAPTLPTGASLSVFPCAS